MRVVELGVVLFLALASAGFAAVKLIGSPPPMTFAVIDASDPVLEEGDDWTPVAASMPGFGNAIRELFGARFAGMWLEGSPSTLKIRVFEITPDDRPALDAIVSPFESRFELVPSWISGAALEHYRASIVQVLRRHPGLAEANVDGERNLVLIDIGTVPSGLADEIEAEGVPARAYAFRDGFGPVEPDMGRQ